MIELTLTNSELKAQINDTDFMLCLYNWYLKDGYACCTSHVFDSQFLHIIIADKMRMIREEVDHKDRNRLNCQRENLRPSTISQNRTNRPTVGASGYRGVNWHNGTQKWRVSVTVKGKSKSFGYFDDVIEAAKTYDKYAKLYLGVFAVLNFPEPT